MENFEPCKPHTALGSTEKETSSNPSENAVKVERKDLESGSEIENDQSLGIKSHDENKSDDGNESG